MNLRNWILNEAKKLCIAGKERNILKFAEIIRKNHFTKTELEDALYLDG